MISSQSPKWQRRLAQLFVAFAFLAGSGTIAFRIILTKPPGLGHGIVPLVIQAKPIARFEGTPVVLSPALVFRDGLELTSSTPQFGGLSGLVVTSDNRFLAVADVGNWVSGRFVEADGHLSGIADATMAPLLDQDGRTLDQSRKSDAEALAMRDGIAFVGIEGSNAILRFDFAEKGLLARANDLPVPKDMRRWPGNAGPEGLAAAPNGTLLDGALVAIAEGARAGGHATEGFIIGGTMPGAFTLKMPGGYGVSDLAFLPNGDLLTLERHIGFGLSMRIRRIAGADIKPGATLSGTVLIDSDTGGFADNMEGLAIHRTADGETILTLIADDNFIFFQRTVLLRFTLKE